MRHPLITRGAFLLMLAGLLMQTGCPPAEHPDLTPHFAAGEGAIAGEIIGVDRDPFDLELAGGRKALKIELISPAQGVAGSAYPLDKKAHFVFNHVAPGRYELTVFAVVTGKRSVAGNLPVTVDADKATPAKLMLTVTPVDGSASPNP